MAYFKRDRFSGIAPGVSPRLLGGEFGQEVKDVDLESGRLIGIYGDSNEDTSTLTDGDRLSIYKYDYEIDDVLYSAWLQWDERVSVVEGPIPDDQLQRLYWTGQDYPRIGTKTSITSGGAEFPGASYRLGVPAPGLAPTVAVSGVADGTLTPNDVSYVYTYVTVDGREGPPSPPSTITEVTDGQTVQVGFQAQTFGNSHNLGTGAKIRLYRSNAGSTNTQFQFVPDGEISFSTGSSASFTDDAHAATLGEVLPSADWIGPPDGDSTLYPSGHMQGLISLANGVMAGFSGKRFCLSVPFMPHAWPISYRITTDADIIAIASTGNGVVALTDGRPYFITGVDPAAMTAIQVDLAQACVNKDSVIDMGDYVLYAGPEGLCAVQSASGSVVTKGLISPSQWNTAFYPTTIKAFKYEGTYVAFHSTGGWVYDPRGANNTLTTLSTSSVFRGGYTDPKDGELYLIVGDVIKKYRGGSNQLDAVFKSKKFVTPAPVSMSWISVHANEYPVTVKVWGDGTLVAHYVLSKAGDTYTQTTTEPSSISAGTLREPVMRMPAVVAQEWEVQVEGKDINEFCLAQSIDEVRGT